MSRLLLSQFPERHKVQALDTGWLPDAHGSISCFSDLSTAEFLLSHFPVSEGEMHFKLRRDSSLAREEEGRSVLMEDRRRQSVAFENAAKEMLKYLEESEAFKVGTTELQEHLEAVQIGITLQQVPQQARKKGIKRFLIFWQEEEESCMANWARWNAQLKGLAELERRRQDTSREIQMLEIVRNAIEGKLRVHSRASEILQDQIIEEIKEMKHKRTEEALELVRKETDLWNYQNEKEEAKRLQGARKLKRKDEENGLGTNQEISQNGLTGKRREVWKKASGGWSLRVKRKCWKSLSCRMRWKALSWTWMREQVEAKLSRRDKSPKRWSKSKWKRAFLYLVRSVFRRK